MKIVVITPVKDEEWVLDRFLWACSRFADHILILDQQSSDKSLEICSRHPKVTVLSNPSTQYDESLRSELLVEGARRLFGEGNLLVAFDADEIPTYPSLDERVWTNLKKLPSGTHICFEKPEMFSLPNRCVRTVSTFPYGFIDDGSSMEGCLIHSRRTPGNPANPHYYSSSIILMHFARVRWQEYCVRQVVYCMIENIRKSKSHRVRTCYYAPEFFTRFGSDSSVAIPIEWTTGYQAAGVDILGFSSSRFNAFHLRVLRLFAEHGVEQFKFDPIWWEAWEEARQHFLQKGVSGLPQFSISDQDLFTRFIICSLTKFYSLCNSFCTFFRKLIAIKGKTTI